MGSEVILFVEHDENIEISDKPHCGSCFSEVTDQAHCGTCVAEGATKLTDKPHCGSCF